MVVFSGENPIATDLVSTDDGVSEGSDHAAPQYEENQTNECQKEQVLDRVEIGRLKLRLNLRDECVGCHQRRENLQPIERMATPENVRDLEDELRNVLDENEQEKSRRLRFFLVCFITIHARVSNLSQA